jgi:hypothetical protein
MRNLKEQKRLAGIGPRFEWTANEDDTDVTVDIDSQPEGDGEGDQELDEGTPREAQSAFDREVVPRMLAPALGQAKKAIMKVMMDLDDGKWPDKKIEYAVMRYKPGTMSDEDFIEGILSAYSDWASKTFK